MRDKTIEAIEGLMIAALLLVGAVIGSLATSWADAQTQRISALESQLALLARQQHEDHNVIFGPIH